MRRFKQKQYAWQYKYDLKQNDKIMNQEIRMVRDYQYIFALMKVKFKVTPIERQSL